MTFDEANKRWNETVNNKTHFNPEEIELMKLYFYKLGINEGVKDVGRKLGLGKSSWDTNPDRMGGQFTKE